MQYGLPRPIAKGHLTEFDGRLLIFQFDGSGFVTNRHRHVQHIKDAMPCGHGTLHRGVLHGQGADGVEKSLDIEDVGHHDTHSQLARQHFVTTDDDDDAHGNPGQNIDSGDHNLRGLGRCDLGIQILPRPYPVTVKIDGFPPVFLHGADAVDIFSQGCVGAG